ncbi:MAG: hypothetical protein HYY18_02620 [Planctomycetes bacterium]|nr:hypothetical protein [Planctomycetota bacterium]
MSEVPREAAGGVEVSRAAFAAIGVAAQASQILLVRELAAVSQGTELAAALVLGVWMAGAAAGSLAGRRGPPVVYAALLAAFVVPSLAVVRLGRAGAAPGEVLTLAHLLAVALVACLPVAALSGALFSSAARRSRDPGRSYAIEAAGAGAAGLLLSLAHQPHVHELALAGGAAALPLLLLVPRRAAVALAPALAILVALAPRADAAARAAWWRSFGPGFAVLETRESPYGSLAAVEYRGQVSLYQSGHLLFSLPDRGEAAPPIHLALLRHPSPRRVLLAGGGVAGALRAVLRHPVERVDYVETDPDVVSLAAPHAGASGLADPRVAFHAADARAFLRAATAASWDAILVVAPGPATLESNRWWTAGFYAEVRRALKPDGVFLAGSVPSYGEVADGPVFARNRLLFLTVRSAFPGAAATAGPATWFFAGGDPESPSRAIPDSDIHSLAEPFALEKINAELSTGAPFDPLADAPPAAASPGPLNTDSRPLAPLRTAALQAGFARDPAARLVARLESLPRAAALLPLALLAAAAALRRRPGPPVFAAGLSGSGSVLLVLAAWESAFGAVYTGVAAVLGLFMLGAAAGALAGRRLPLAAAVAASAASAALAAATFAVPFMPFHAAAAALAGAATGACFPAALRIAGPTATGRLYAIDLAGGMLGALVIAPLGLPLFGAAASGAFLAAACAVTLPAACASAIPGGQAPGSSGN